MTSAGGRSGRRLVVEADGGSRGNPGPAGYGAVVRDAGTGEVLREAAASVGRATNNVAEYHGLLAGLRAAAELAPGAEVEVRMDSKLVVEQMSGRWQIRHPDMRVLARQARELLAGLGPVRFRHVPRERNTHADRLANEAMDAAALGRQWQPAGPVRAAAGAPGSAPPAPPPEQGPPVRTVLARHARTVLTEQRRFAGTSDPELSPAGEAEAAALAGRLAAEGVHYARVVSSPLRRARQTAAAVAAALDVPVAVDEDLREAGFGAWEGLAPADAAARWPAEYAAWRSTAEAAPPRGESLAAVNRRVRRARDRLLAAGGEGPVLVVSHLTPIAVLVRLALAAPELSARRVHVEPTGLSELDWYPDGRAVLRRLNDTAHLG